VWRILTLSLDEALARRLAEHCPDDCDLRFATTLGEALDVGREVRPDATILTTEQSAASWLSQIRSLRQALPEQAIVAVAATSTDTMALEALRAGADDVIDPEMEPAELISRVVTLCSFRVGPGSAVRRAEARLRAAEARYRLLVEKAPFGVVLLQNGRVAYMNPAGATIGRVAADGIIGQHVADLVGAADTRAATELHQRIISGALPDASGQIAVTLLDGTVLTLAYEATITEHQGEPSIMVMYRDVGEQIAREQAISRRQRELELLHGLALDLTASLDLEKVVSTGCTRIATLAGLDACAIYLVDGPSGALALAAERHDPAFPPLRQTLPELREVPRTPVVVALDRGDWRAEHLAGAASSARGGLGSAIVVPLRARDRVIGMLEGARRAEHPLTEDDLRLLVPAATSVGLAVENARLFATLQDSYHRIVQTQAELVRAERLAALGELSATVAHEVRNPLAAIYNALSQLRRLVPREAPGETLLDIAQEEATRLNRMIGDLLQFARPGEPDVRPMPVDDVVLAAVRAATMDPQARAEVELAVDRIHPDLLALGDAGRVKQALVNIIVNAYQAIEGKGTIRVRARPADDGSAIEIVIEDDGAGMTADVLERAFDPFFTTRPMGSGLGLSIVRRLVEDQGGTVEAASAPGESTRFTVRLARAIGPDL